MRRAARRRRRGQPAVATRRHARRARQRRRRSGPRRWRAAANAGEALRPPPTQPRFLCGAQVAASVVAVVRLGSRDAPQRASRRGRHSSAVRLHHEAAMRRPVGLAALRLSPSLRRNLCGCQRRVDDSTARRRKRCRWTGDSLRSRSSGSLRDVLPLVHHRVSPRVRHFGGQLQSIH